MAALVALPMAGSAIAVALRPSQGADHEVQALVVVGGSASGDSGARRDRVRSAAVIARSAQAAASARDFAAASGSPTLRLPDVRKRIDVRADPVSGVIRVDARAHSDIEASALANGVALQAATLARRLTPAGSRTGRLVIGDFEGGIGYWILSPVFNAAPHHAKVTRTVKHDGQASLVATCRAEIGCGPSTRVYHLFRAGVPYTATLWVRIRPGDLPVSAVFGSTPTDVITTEPVKVGTGWRRLSVAWTPHHDAAVASVGIQTRRLQASRIWVDGVTLYDPTLAGPGESAVPTPAEESRALSAAAAVVISPARVTGTTTDRTVVWAMAGAGIGLAIALGAVLAGRFAERRRQRQP